MKVQRLRIRYGLAAPACDLSNREQIAAWEDALRAAGLVVSYSEGKRPAAQISIATLLPLGVTSDTELIDVFLEERTDPRQTVECLRGTLPQGIEPLSAEEVGVNSPSLQSLVQWAEFAAVIPSDGLSAAEVQARIDRLLAAETWPAEYRRETRVREYDLRPLVGTLVLESEEEGAFRVAMKLRAAQEATARVDQVILALGLPAATRICRKRLHIEQAQAAVLAYRRAGELDEL